MLAQSTVLIDVLSEVLHVVGVAPVAKIFMLIMISIYDRCWCWRRSNALVMLVLRIWLIMSLADFRLAALQSQECGRPGQQRHRFSHLASTTWWSWWPDGADEAGHLADDTEYLVVLFTWWWGLGRGGATKTDNFSEEFQTRINFKQLSKIKNASVFPFEQSWQWQCQWWWWPCAIIQGPVPPPLIPRPWFIEMSPWRGAPYCPYTHTTYCPYTHILKYTKVRSTILT